MKKRILTVIYIASFFAIVSCNDPVFHTISQEVEPIEPRIKGAAANFSLFTDPKNIDDPEDDITYMYTASGSSLHRYYYNNETDKNIWEKAPGPGGRILQLASTGKYLYALCNQGSGLNISLKRFDNTTWIDIDSEEFFGTLQFIFSAGDKLFLGGDSGNRFSVFYLDEEASAKTAIKSLTLSGVEEITSVEISGAAGNGTNYYFCTRSAGIFTTADPSDGASIVSGSEKIHFTGIINLENAAKTIVAITRSGEIYTVGEAIAKVEGITMDSRYSTGALAVWEDKDDPLSRLLLAGRQDELTYTTTSGYTYGYLELELDANGIVNGAVYTEPGLKKPSSIGDGDNARYKSTIGKYPVKHIFQAPRTVDSKMTLFASTQKDGVFSYRFRDPWQWNAEE